MIYEVSFFFLLLSFMRDAILLLCFYLDLLDGFDDLFRDAWVCDSL